jgi:radical SAM protein with 4Fe4S-binding SPASM domain
MKCKDFEKPRINPEGKIIFCQFIREKVGDLTQSSLSSIWNSEKILAIREKLNSNNLSEICKRCCKLTTPKLKTDNIQSVLIEPTNICNLNCPMCRTKKIPKKDRKEMTLKEFKVILSKLSTKPKLLMLWNNGEPLINNHIYEMIKYAKKTGIKYVKICTNATLLNHDNSIKLLKSKIDEILIGFDGATKETYEFFRRGSDFEKVKKNISNLCKLRNKLNTKTKIGIEFVLNKKNEDEIDKIKQLAHNIKVNFIRLKTMYIDNKNNSSILPKNKEFWRYQNDVTTYRGDFSSCEYLHNHLYINVNGDVIPCCDYSLDKSYTFGNIFKKSLSEIWNSTKFEDFRRTIHTNKDKLKHCKNCSGSNRRLVYKIINL